MLQITPHEVTPEIRALFSTNEPQARRCFAVLDGSAPIGKIIVDKLIDSQWAIVQEIVDNSVYLGGKITRSTFAKVFAALQQEGDVLIGMWDDDPRMILLPADRYYDGRTLEFYDRPLGHGLDLFMQHIPADCILKRIDRDLIMRTTWGPGDVQLLGGLDNWDKACIGYCLMQGVEILSEASVGPPALGLYEPGVYTQEAHRGKGYGTMVSARLIQELEKTGGKTYWNCAKQNLASAAIARKLGYRIEKEYRCMAWRKSSFNT